LVNKLLRLIKLFSFLDYVRGASSLNISNL